MKFKSAYLKLTVFYVMIVMFISITFSIVLYQLSSQELSRASRHQGGILRSLSSTEFSPNRFQEFEMNRIVQLKESNNRLLLNLTGFNILIFFLSGGISYFLARKTLKPIEEMIDIQNRFTADASHELRTPLTAMKTEIEVNLRDKDFNFNDAKKLLQSNLEEISKLEILSNELLELDRYQQDQITEHKNISLKNLVEEAKKKVANLAANKKIRLKLNMSDAIMKGNKQGLIELFVILFDNAIKYSPKNSEVLVSSEIIGHQFNIKFKDQGVGTKAFDLPHIFNRFYRTDISRSKEQPGGYGLGLSIAEKIVENHHGKIEVKSKPNQGSVFIVKFPIK